MSKTEEVTYVHSIGEDGSVFSRFTEYAPDALPGWLKAVLQAFPDADDIAISLPTRPNHFKNHVIKRKTAQGVSGAK